MIIFCHDQWVNGEQQQLTYSLDIVDYILESDNHSPVDQYAAPDDFLDPSETSNEELTQN